MIDDFSHDFSHGDFFSFIFLFYSLQSNANGFHRRKIVNFNEYEYEYIFYEYIFSKIFTKNIDKVENLNYRRFELHDSNDPAF